MPKNINTQPAKQQPIPKTMKSFLIYFIKPYSLFLIGMMLTGTFWAFQTSFAPYMLKLIIDGLANEETRSVENAIKPAMAYVGLFVLVGFNFRFLDWIKLRMLPAIRRDIIVKMYEYLLSHSYHFFQNNFAGSLSNKITDMNSSMVSIIEKFDETFAQATAIIVAFIVMYSVHPIFAAILLVWAIVFLGVSFYCSKRIASLSKEFSESVTTIVGKIVDGITNVVNVRFFSRYGHEVKRIEKGMDNAVAKDRKMQWFIIKLRIFQDVSIVFMIGSMLYSLLYLYKDNQVTEGDFILVMNIAMSIFWAFWFLASQFASFFEDLGKCQQALSIITTDHDIVDVEHATALQVEAGEIKFNNVHFAYPNSPTLFESLSFEIPAGKKIGLVGYSGSGKSSLVSLILRLYDIHNGEILIDGTPIQTVTQDSLRENISLVPQNSMMFHRTLFENIGYGNIDATESDIFSVANQAHCAEFIEQMPEGYNALVGERGIKLSGGQKQRIAIAQAMLKNAKILILDEATSALDSVTEKYIQESFHELMKGRTTLVIAHRLSTLLEMDEIIVMDKGKIIERGSHQVLVNQNGQYAKMWSMQSQGFLPDKPKD